MDIEALDALGLRRMGWSLSDLRAAAAITLLLGLVYLYYFWRQEPSLWLDLSVSLIVALWMMVFVIIAKVVIPTHALLPFLVPYAALTMLLSVTIRFRLAVLLTGLFAILVGWLSVGDVELMAYALLPGLVGAIKLRRGEHLASFAWAAVYVALTNVLVILAFRVGSGDWDVRGLAELVGVGLFSGLISMAATLLGVYLVGAAFGVTTSLQLMELSRPTHPLLRHLLLKAPGTYHHTLIVANMAERAAEAIDADALLTRVGSYYHDVGKTIRPYFHREPDRCEMIPITPRSVTQRQVIAHVKDGLARSTFPLKRVAPSLSIARPVTVFLSSGGQECRLAGRG
jgi:putative nucleotidyltransferase with HDIG domain